MILYIADDPELELLPPSMLLLYALPGWLMEFWRRWIGKSHAAKITDGEAISGEISCCSPKDQPPPRRHPSEFLAKCIKYTSR